MSNQELQKALINAARILHPVDNDPLEVSCAKEARDTVQVASDRLGLCVMLTATDCDRDIDICLSRKDAIQVACAILAHAGGLPE